MNSSIMSLSDLLDKYRGQIIDKMVQSLLSDQSSRYSKETEEGVRTWANIAIKSFKSALVYDKWEEVRHFSNTLAKKRMEEGFKLSEIQKAFELYRQILTPLIILHTAKEDLNDVLLHVHRFMVEVVTHFSEYFQNLHELFLRNYNEQLETEVQQRTKDLAASELKYKSLVEDINDGYFVLVGSRIVFSNRTFSHIHGYALNDIRGMPYLELVAEESRNEVKKAYEDSRSRRRTPARIEYFRLHRDGRHLPTEIIAKLSSYEGEIANLGICRDITQRVELERKTREAKTLSALAEQAVSLAHEIQNPLSAIKMNTQMLSGLPETTSRQKKLFDTMLKGIGQIDSSVTQMLDLRVPFRLQCRRVPLRPLLESCLVILQPRLKNKNISVSMRLSKRVLNIWADPDRIQQALINVLFNAIEILPLGGRVFLSSRLVREDGLAYSQIRVADNGPGIPKELMSYAFDPFFSKRRGGTGLGLSNVKKIVEAHRGKVIMVPRKPRGINFYLRLPTEAWF